MGQFKMNNRGFSNPSDTSAYSAVILTREKDVLTYPELCSRNVLIMNFFAQNSTIELREIACPGKRTDVIQKSLSRRELTVRLAALSIVMLDERVSVVSLSQSRMCRFP